MRSLRVLLAALLLGAGLVLASALPASACSCVAAGAAQQVKWADRVFLGSVVWVDPSDERDDYAYDVLVRAQFKGAVSDRTTVSSDGGTEVAAWGRVSRRGGPTSSTRTSWTTA